jgi:hypothetical protein
VCRYFPKLGCLLRRDHVIGILEAIKYINEPLSAPNSLGWPSYALNLKEQQLCSSE